MRVYVCVLYTQYIYINHLVRKYRHMHPKSEITNTSIHIRLTHTYILIKLTRIPIRPTHDTYLRRAELGSVRAIVVLGDGIDPPWGAHTIAKPLLHRERELHMHQAPCNMQHVMSHDVIHGVWPWVGAAHAPSTMQHGQCHITSFMVSYFVWWVCALREVLWGLALCVCSQIHTVPPCVHTPQPQQ